MTTNSARRLVFLHSHPQYLGQGAPPTPKAAYPLAITICSQSGSGGLPVAQDLATLLQQKGQASEQPWQVLASGLIEKVLEEHHLPTRMARFLPEDANSAVDDTL